MKKHKQQSEDAGKQAAVEAMTMRPLWTGKQTRNGVGTGAGPREPKARDKAAAGG